MLINPNIKQWITGSIFILLLFSLMAYWLQISSADNSQIPKDLQNVVLKSPKSVADFELLNQFGEPFTQKSFIDKWTFLFFGYTHCPDICPTTMMELNLVAKRIKPTPPLQNNIQYVFVSVDPQRDTMEHLRDYVAYFNQEFIALTGNIDKINVLTKQLGIKHSKGEGTENNYAVNHSSAILLINPQGQYFAKFKAPHYAETLTSKFTLIQLFQQQSS